jgi:hypothetical protein
MKARVLIVAALAVTGCFHAPPIIMVDRATALEEQAAGSFDDVEKRLDRAGMTPAPAPLTPDQLDALGIKPMPLVERRGLTAADHVDELLVQHCVGEGSDGLLVDTHDACRGASDAVADAALVERVNHARLQLWRWMHGIKPDATESALRGAWRKAHIEHVVCGGWLQGDDGKWEEKKC